MFELTTEKRPMPRFQRFKIPPSYPFPGLGVPGDTLVCKLLGKMRSLPRSKRKAEEAGLMGEWFVFVKPDGGTHVMRLLAFGTSRWSGHGYGHDGSDFSDGVCISEYAGGFGSETFVYVVIEAQPHGPRRWQDDPDLMVVAIKLGFTDDEIGVVRREGVIGNDHDE